MRHVVFRIEKDRFALPLGAVREVVLPPEGFTQVPRTPPAVRGVMNLRGRVVTVVDLRTLLGIEGSSASLKVVLLDRGRRDLGFLVTEVDGIESIERVAPSTARAEAKVRGVARLGGQAVTVLDPDGLDGAITGLFGSK
jgi:purine-binding chemotaxis protein CheW